MLNQDQTKGLKALIDFAYSTDKEFILEGMAGVGKTYLLNQFQEELKKQSEVGKLLNLKGEFSWEMLYTATTNKAATLLPNGITVHKALNIRLEENHRTGKLTVSLLDKIPLPSNVMLIVDEASMLDEAMRNIILSKVSKVIYLMDAYQLGPIGSTEPILNTLNTPSVSLLQPMRQDKDSVLYTTCTQLREAVKNQQYFNIPELVDIHYLGKVDWVTKALGEFKEGKDIRVLAFKNEVVETINTYFKQQLSEDAFWASGSIGVVGTGNKKLKAEQPITVIQVSGDIHTYMGLTCATCMTSEGTFKLPLDKKQYFSRKKQIAKECKDAKDWGTYFQFIEEVLDLRESYCTTVHKSQGSTFDSVYIHLGDILKCKDSNTLLRLIYVAVSRARSKVYLYMG